MRDEKLVDDRDGSKASVADPNIPLKDHVRSASAGDHVADLSAFGRQNRASMTGD